MKNNFSIKSFLTLSFLILISSFSNAQDLILKRGGDEIYGKVLEIKEDRIFYKKAAADTLILSIEKQQVFMVKFENGAKIVFDQPIVAEPKVEPPKEELVEEPKPSPLIEVKGSLYYYNGRYYSFRRLSPILKESGNPLVKENVINAKVAHTTGTVLFSSSFAFAGVGLLSLLASQEPNSNTGATTTVETNPTLVGIGLIGIATGVIFQAGNIVMKKIIRNNYEKRAIELYNQQMLKEQR